MMMKPEELRAKVKKYHEETDGNEPIRRCHNLNIKAKDYYLIEHGEIPSCMSGNGAENVMDPSDDVPNCIALDAKRYK